MLISITYPEDTTGIQDLEMHLKHRVGKNWKGRRFKVNVVDDD